MPRPYVRLRETTFDLYVERDLLPGYYKLISISSSWLVLAGYILFAIVFTTREDDLNTTQNLMTALASALLIVGYVGIVMVALFGKSLLFLIDGVILPCLSSSVLGLVATVANFILHKELATAQVYVSIPLVTACVTTVVSTIILAIAYRELRKIRRRDERRRWHVQMRPYTGGQSDSQNLPGVPSPDDEAQRRQLMRLLQERQGRLRTPDEIQNTFKIDLPGEPKYETRRDPSFDGRTDFPDRAGFSLGNLVPWRTNKDNTFKDARERRREEIERASVSNLSEAYRSYDPRQYQSTPTTAWGWPPATRYA